MYRAKFLSPMIPSFNLKKTAAFFIDLLDFDIRRDDTTYVILQKNNLTVHILRAGAEIGEMEFYLEVDDIEAVWHNMAGKLEGIKFKEPFDQIYGMREIHLIIPETKTLLFIGQTIN